MSVTLLLVDDESNVTAALTRELRDLRGGWQVLAAACVSDAWRLLQSETVDIVVLDVSMPGRSGFDLLQDMADQGLLESIPVVMLTGEGDDELKRRAIEIGAADLLCKPAETIDLVVRIDNMLKLKAATDELRRHQAELEDLVAERTVKLERSRSSLIIRLAMIAEMRDSDTGNHIVRVGCYAEEIARQMGLEPEFRKLILLSSPMHDIGKIAISDAILLKRGPLTAEEWVVMRTHCELGATMLQEEPRLVAQVVRYGHFKAGNDARDDEVLSMAARIALCHHERWDGKGYPRGLREDEIPLEARIVAVADAFDALTTPRPYRAPVQEHTALEILMADQGSHFDHAVFDAFTECFPRIRAIRRSLRDIAAPEKEAA